MAAALPYIMTAFAAAGTVMQANAASDARKQGRANARALQEQNMEEARRLKKEQTETERRAAAAAAASGTGFGSTSQETFLADMRKEHQSELAWLKKSGASRAAAAKMEGKIAGKQAMAGALSSAASTASSAYSYFGPKG